MYLESGGAGQFACYHWGELGVWSMQMAMPPVAAAVVGDGGGHGGDGIDSAHHNPGAPPLDGLEMGGAILVVAVATTGVVVEVSYAVTLMHSKSHFLQK